MGCACTGLSGRGAQSHAHPPTCAHPAARQAPSRLLGRPMLLVPHWPPAAPLPGPAALRPPPATCTLASPPASAPPPSAGCCCWGCPGGGTLTRGGSGGMRTLRCGSSICTSGHAGASPAMSFAYFAKACGAGAGQGRGAEEVAGCLRPRGWQARPAAPLPCIPAALLPHAPLPPTRPSVLSACLSAAALPSGARGPMSQASRAASSRAAWLLPNLAQAGAHGQQAQGEAGQREQHLPQH